MFNSSKIFLVYINLKDITVPRYNWQVNRKKLWYERFKSKSTLDLGKVESKTLFEIPELNN